MFPTEHYSADKRKLRTDTGNIGDESLKHHVEPKKPDTEDHMLQETLLLKTGYTNLRSLEN